MLTAEGNLRDLRVCPFIHLHCIVSMILSVHFLFIVRIATNLALLSSMDGWMDGWMLNGLTLFKKMSGRLSHAMPWHIILHYIEEVKWSIA